jgi:hypothetical protein
MECDGKRSATPLWPENRERPPDIPARLAIAHMEAPSPLRSAAALHGVDPYPIPIALVLKAVEGRAPDRF